MSEEKRHPVLNFSQKLFEEYAGEALFDPDLAGAAWLIFLGVLVVWGIYMISVDPQWGGVAANSDLLSINPDKWPKV
jgi:hypothetical protein